MIEIRNIIQTLIREELKKPRPYLDGKSKEQAKRKLYNIMKPLVTGIFTDTGWKHVHEIWNLFDVLDINITHTSNAYEQTMPPSWKRWTFTINWNDNNGKQQTLYGNLLAGGCGTVADPLGKYDLTLTIS